MESQRNLLGDRICFASFQNLRGPRFPPENRRPYEVGVTLGGGWLTSHEYMDPMGNFTTKITPSAKVANCHLSSLCKHAIGGTMKFVMLNAFPVAVRFNTCERHVMPNNHGGHHHIILLEVVCHFDSSL